METFVAILFVAILVYVLYKFMNAKNPIDENQDGKIDTAEAVKAAEAVAEKIKEDAKAAEAAVEKVKEELQQTVVEAVKKVRKSRKKTDDTTS